MTYIMHLPPQTEKHVFEPLVLRIEKAIQPLFQYNSQVEVALGAWLSKAAFVT